MRPLQYQQGTPRRHRAGSQASSATLRDAADAGTPPRAARAGLASVDAALLSPAKSWSAPDDDGGAVATPAARCGRSSTLAEGLRPAALTPGRRREAARPRGGSLAGSHLGSSSHGSRRRAPSRCVARPAAAPEGAT